MNLPATLDAAEAARTAWDALVIGAGPAGAFAARGLAQAGLRTLLVEAKTPPRPKVCGGCLNRRGVELLVQAGLGESLSTAGAVPLARFRFLCRGRDQCWPLPGTIALQRSTLDTLLIVAAVAAGSDFLPATSARVLSEEAEEFRHAGLKPSEGGMHRAAARVVVCADGLNHPSLADHPEFASRVRPGSRIGLQSLLEASAEPYPSGELTMAVGRAGYVGLTRVDGGGLNVAAAIDPRRLSDGARPGEIIRDVMMECRLPVPERLARAAWSGTPPLTRASRAVSARRLFLIGDAAGYVEPFTGEGMTWALESAAAVVPAVCSARSAWSGELSLQWRRILKRKVTSRQWMCRLLTELLRRPSLAGAAIDLCRLVPPVRILAMRTLSGVPRKSA